MVCFWYVSVSTLHKGDDDDDDDDDNNNNMKVNYPCVSHDGIEGRGGIVPLIIKLGTRWK
jgi:hypothetical protein